MMTIVPFVRQSPLALEIDMLTLQFDPHRGKLATEQLKEQIRYSIAVDLLRPGDALPSVRDVAHSSGITRNTVHRAYKELQEEGTVVCWQGKGVFVAPQAASVDDAFLLRTAQHADRLLRELNIAGVHPVSFAHFCLQRFRELDRRHPRVAVVDVCESTALHLANQVSRRWGIAVEGQTLEALQDFQQRLGATWSTILTNYALARAVRDIAPDTGDVLPVVLKLDASSRQALEHVPEGALVLALFDPKEWEAVGAFYRSQIEESLRAEGSLLETMTIEDINETTAVVARLRPHLTLIGGRLAERLPRSALARLTPLALSIDPAALHTIRDKAGVLIPTG
jgi:GntR family transcriptional regulator